MDDRDWRLLKEIFHRAIECAPEERARLLDEACAGRPEVRAEVEALLDVHDRKERTRGAAVEPPAAGDEAPGSTIGRYKLLQQIGEGGFGVVYMAEQTEPVQRKVALKVIKLGMDTKQVIARFEAERQALALMDHGNIARVFDGGTTAQGRPYFVMELVKGVPITEYCDEASLGVAERLELFQQVCHAVQHAHQKGIIHRDLKPSNVLVTLHDGRPVPKVIDFGIAKATDRRLTEKTLFTEFRQMIGTPEYMAPEQAEISGLDVDTRADIYSLGVLLYELLTGTKPFELATLLEKGYEEILRTIREVDPHKPSTRVSTLGEQLAVVARSRQTPPKLLGRLLRGDLDWIVMRALEKDRSRRYETPAALAEDLGRYLTDRPVLASPPGRGYRLAKYVRRHRVGVAAAVAVLLALVVGAGLSLAGFFEARRQRDVARTAEAAALRQAGEARTEASRAEEILDLIQEMLGSADPHEDKGPIYTVRQLLDDFARDLGDRLASQPEVDATIRDTMGMSYLGLGLPDEAEPHLRAALETRRRVLGEAHPRTLESRAHWARLVHDRSDFRKAADLWREILAIRERAGDTEGTAEALEQLGDNLHHLAKYKESEQLLRRALEIRRRVLGEDHEEVAEVLDSLAFSILDKGSLDEARRLLEQSLAMRRRLGLPDAGTLFRLGNVLAVGGDVDEAERLAKEALASFRRLYGEDHVEQTGCLGLLAELQFLRGNIDEAIRLHREALEIVKRSYGDGHVNVAHILTNLAWCLHTRERSPEALRMLRDALSIAEAPSKQRAFALRHLGDVLAQKGRTEEARGALDEALAIERRLHGDDHPAVAWVTQSYAACEFFGGDLAQAEALWTDALERLRKVTEDSHPSLLDMWGGLGKIRAKRRDRDGAADAFRKALEMARSHYGDGPKVSIYLNNLGGLELNMGDPAAAETWFRDSLRQPGQDEISMATTRSNLSIALGKQGKWAEATEQIEEAVRAAREKLGVHPWTARNLFNLGEAYRRQGQLSKAEPVYREACEIVGKLDLGEGNPIAFRNREGLVHSLVGQEKWAEVEPAVRELLKEHGAQHSPAERANWLVTLGRSLLRTGEPARAEAPLREALEIREEALGDHWARYNAMSLLGASLAGQEKHADAEPLLVEAFEKMAPPERLASRREEALERVIALYEAWGKPDEAAAWRAKAR